MAVGTIRSARTLEGSQGARTPEGSQGGAETVRPVVSAPLNLPLSALNVAIVTTGIRTKVAASTTTFHLFSTALLRATPTR